HNPRVNGRGARGSGGTRRVRGGGRVHTAVTRSGEVSRPGNTTRDHPKRAAETVTVTASRRLPPGATTCLLPDRQEHQMHINTGDTAWVLMSSALVLLMTPGLAFFYGGMVRSKSVLNMLMMSMLTIGIVTPLWVLFGFSLTFGTQNANGFIGDLSE